VLLKRANLVHGARGPGGGYRLARPAENISVASVLKALEGPLMGVDLKNPGDRMPVSTPARRLIEAFARAVETAEKILDEVTVADLCKPEDRAQVGLVRVAETSTEPRLTRSPSATSRILPSWPRTCLSEVTYPGILKARGTSESGVTTAEKRKPSALKPARFSMA